MEMEQINGRDEDSIKNIKELQDLIGVKSKNVFGVKTVEELEDKLNEMMLIDLQKLAVSSGISGNGTPLVLKRKITNEFLKLSKGSDNTKFSMETLTKIEGKGSNKRKEFLETLE